MRRQLWLAVALVVSLSFNAGLLIGGWRSNGSRNQAEPDLGDYPSEFYTLCDRLQGDLQTLRARQAEATHDLADLMTCPAPDRAAIDRCLDRLTATDREIKRVVVETVLSQRELLPDSERKTFCDKVQRRLCESYADCAMGDGCASKTSPTHAEPTRNPCQKEAFMNRKTLYLSLAVALVLALGTPIVNACDGETKCDVERKCEKSETGVRCTITAKGETTADQVRECVRKCAGSADHAENVTVTFEDTEGGVVVVKTGALMRRPSRRFKPRPKAAPRQPKPARPAAPRLTPRRPPRARTARMAPKRPPITRTARTPPRAVVAPRPRQPTTPDRHSVT